MPVEAPILPPQPDGTIEPPELAQPSERLLEGKVILFTGATSPINLVVTQRLLREGAIVVGPHITNRSRKEKLLTTYAEEHGSTVSLPIADMTEPDNITRVVGETVEHYGGIDIVIHGMAGGIVADEADPDKALKVNAIAPEKLTQTALPYMRKDFRFIDIQSVWSKLNGLITQLPGYGPVAETKHEGRRRLLALIPQIEALGGKYYSVCAHGVTGPTIQILGKEGKRIFEEEGDDRFLIEKIEASAKDGIFSTPDNVADSVMKLATSDYPQGHIEYVGTDVMDREAVSEALPMYGPHKLMPDEVIFVGDETVARMNITQETARSPLDRGEITLDMHDIGHFRTTEAHVAGHFDEAFGLQLFRGVDQVQAAIAGARTGMQRYGVVNPMLERLDGIEFKYPVPAGVDVNIHYEDLAIEGGSLTHGARTASILLESADTPIMTIEHGRMIAIDDPTVDVEAHHHRLTQGIELAAQTLGIIGLKKTGLSAQDQLPLFAHIGHIELMQFDGAPSDTLEVKVTTRSTDNEGVFAGDATIYDGGRPFASISDISGVMGGVDQIRRISKRRMAKLLEAQTKA